MSLPDQMTDCWQAKVVSRGSQQLTFEENG
jgi:hypothetical protein